MGDSRKKVIVRRHLGPALFGYLPASGFVTEGQLSLLDLDGRLTHLPLAEVRIVFFVRDFNRGDPFNPERLTRKAFASRPRGEGIWIRLALEPDRETLEGLAPPDRSLLDGLVHDLGVFLTPPDTRLNTLRIFVPYQSIQNFQVLGLIGVSRPRPNRAAAPAVTADRPGLAPGAVQEDLFSTAPSPSPRPHRKVSGE